MGNVSGQFYGFTGFFPILEDAQSSHAEALRGVLATMDYGPGSLFSRTGLVHGGRFFIIDDVVYNGAPSREEHLAYSYLAMSLTFDGDLPALADRLAATGEPDLGRIFVHCYGYPGSANSLALLDYLHRCQVETTFLFTDQDSVSLKATLRALKAQQLITEMVVKGQGMDTAARRTLLRETRGRIAALTDPVPGGFGAGGGEP